MPENCSKNRGRTGDEKFNEYSVNRKEHYRVN